MAREIACLFLWIEFWTIGEQKHRVFEAVLQTGVRRVVIASSQHVTGGFYLEEP